MAFALNYTTAWERFLEWYRGSLLDRFFTFLGERVFVVSFGEYQKIPLSSTAGKTAQGWILSFLVAFWVAAVAVAFVKTVPGGFVRRLLALGATDADHAVTLAEAGYARSAAIKRDLSGGGALAKLLARPDDNEKTVAGLPIPDPTTEVDPETGASRPSLIERLETPEKTIPSTAETGKTAVETAAPEGGEQKSDEQGDVAQEADEQKSDEQEISAPAPLNFATDRFYIPKGLCARAEIRFAKNGSGVLAVLLSVLGSTAVAFALCNLLPTLFRFANWLLGG